MRTVYRK